MKLVIYGNSDFAELMTYYFSSDSEYEIAGYCVDRAFIHDTVFLGKPLVPFEEVETVFPPSEYDMFVAVGYKSMRLRKALFEKTKAKGYRHANYISSAAHIDDSNVIGVNNAILHRAVLEPFAKIGDNNIINTSVIVCHHSNITDHCFIAAKASVGGYSVVGENSFLGFGSTVLQKLSLAQETLVGAQALLTCSTEPFSTYVGVPAKKTVKSHEAEGIKIIDA